MTANVTEQHPLYAENLEDWRTMRDTYEGERKVKDAGLLYLPATSGMLADGLLGGTTTPGYQAYDAYRKRAVFPDAVKDAVRAMLGVMHHKPPVIELPAAMEPMRERATLQGESLAVLLRRINLEQLVTGRLGLLLDLPGEQIVGEVQPYVALYQAESIINWDAGRRDGLGLETLNLVVLDESESERQGLSWRWVTKHRVLVLGELGENEREAPYRVGVFREENASFSEAALTEPSLRGNRLTQVPFVFVNATDVVVSPGEPPLLGLARLALAIYRGEADYRQALFAQGQDTLVVIGSPEDDEFRLGANAAITLPVGGDAKFIGVDSAGLPEMRMALEHDKAEAAQKGGQLVESVSRERESGEALKIRVAARTATLNEVALAGAFGLERVLKVAAAWMGANPEEVMVVPNLDFSAEGLEGRTLVEYLTAKTLGAPLSLRSIHDRMRERDLTTMTYEEELVEIEGEAELGGGGSVNDDGPEPGEDE